MTKTSEKEVVQDLATLMAGWNKIESAAKEQFPHATKDELYEICKGAMNHALAGTKLGSKATHRG